jgi:MFS superfamily sulfate permease-like transporter
VSTDLLMGVLTGLALSVLQLLYKATHLKVILNASEEQRRADLHLEGAATFMRLAQLAATLEKVPHDMHLQIHVDRLYYIDHTCFHLLRSAASQRESQGSRLEIAWDVIDARYRGVAVAS